MKGVEGFNQPHYRRSKQFCLVLKPQTGLRMMKVIEDGEEEEAKCLVDLSPFPSIFSHSALN